MLKQSSVLVRDFFLVATNMYQLSTHPLSEETIRKVLTAPNNQYQYPPALMAEEHPQLSWIPLVMTNISPWEMAHWNRWFTVLKNGDFPWLC